ncbi:hypothetical protein RND71_039858 [Anisodus tanguticus]|uniref:Uncharacterized protein n=1 Tax=Anisodus tanguticus TaxID=243964 RepID=A0AAE1R0D6_9SOLA|nr:hypothetical protein RND71_039858 [Anisodus tanguticus]
MFLCFDKFSYASCLKDNMGKTISTLGGVKQEVRDEILQFLSYSEGELPFKYLRIPLSTKKSLFTQWVSLIEKIISRITSWTSKKLNNHMLKEYN